MKTNTYTVEELKSLEEELRKGIHKGYTEDILRIAGTHPHPDSILPMVLVQVIYPSVKQADAGNHYTTVIVNTAFADRVVKVLMENPNLKTPEALESLGKLRINHLSPGQEIQAAEEVNELISKKKVEVETLKEEAAKPKDFTARDAEIANEGRSIRFQKVGLSSPAFLEAPKQKLPKHHFTCKVCNATLKSDKTRATGFCFRHTA